MQAKKTYRYLPLTQLLNDLKAQGFKIGVNGYLDLQRLIAQLDPQTDNHTLKQLICPLFASDADEQAYFYRAFDKYFEPEIPKTETRAQKVQARQARSVLRLQDLRQRTLVLVGLNLLFSLLIIVIFFLAKEDQQDSTPGNPNEEVAIADPSDAGSEPIRGVDPTDSTWAMVTDAAELAQTGQTQKALAIAHDISDAYYRSLALQAIAVELAITGQTDWAMNIVDEISDATLREDTRTLVRGYTPKTIFEDFLFWIIGAVAVFILLALLLSRWYVNKRRKLVAQYKQDRKPPFVWPIEFDEDIQVDLDDGFYIAAAQMRKRVLDRTLKLDIHSTIRSTVENGGALDVQYKQQTKPAEYLVLIDQTSPKNHQAALFEFIAQKFHKNDIHIVRYYYDGDPRICWNESNPNGVSLRSLVQHYPDYRLLIFGSGSRLISAGTGKLNRWTDLLAEWPERAILTPKATSLWDYHEIELSQSFVLLPASAQGMAELVHHFENTKVTDLYDWKFSEEKSEPAIDLAGDVDTVLPRLKEYLSEQDIDEVSENGGAEAPTLLNWVAACCMYTELFWDLTLYIGQALSDDDQNLLTQHNLLKLSRLTWFQAGRIPDEFKQRLLSEEFLPKNIRTKVAEALAALLKKNAPTDKSMFAYDHHRMNLVVSELMLDPRGRKKRELLRELQDLHDSETVEDYTSLNLLAKSKISPLDFVMPEQLKKQFRGKNGRSKIKVATGWATAILGLIITFILTFDNIKGWLAPPTAHQEYRLILLDSSSGMTADWEMLKAAVSRIFYAHDKRIQKLALRQFGGPCSSPIGNLKIKFGEEKKFGALLEDIRPIGGEATLIQALWNTIGDFADLERLNSEQQFFNTITVITASGEACNPEDTTRIKKRLEALKIDLEFQIIPMGLEENELEVITDLAKSLGESYIIFPANNLEELDLAIQNPEIADAFFQGKNYWLNGDDEKAIPLLEQAAKEGVSEAMLVLGDIHADITKETHTETDDEQAIEWYKKSAKAGKVAAMTRLGIMYRDGRGVGDDTSRNYDQARDWFTRAADLGDTEAKKNLDNLPASKSPEPTPDIVKTPNSPPSAINLKIAGKSEIGSTLQATYVFADAEGVREGQSSIRWLRNGFNVPGQTGKTYKLSAADKGSTISFEITPVAQSGKTVGKTVRSLPIGPITEKLNQPPLVVSIEITGIAEVDQVLKGNYIVRDPERDPLGQATLRWLRNGVPIPGATSGTYKLTPEDHDARITFEVTPVAQTGIVKGKSKTSVPTKRIMRYRPRDDENAKPPPPSKNEDDKTFVPPKTQPVAVNRLRSQPLADLSENSVKKMLLDKDFYDSDWNKGGSGFANRFKIVTTQGEKLVVDAASGLTWQQSGSATIVTYKEAAAYIEKLKKQQFAGYADWRLPTLEEAMSLMEPKKLNDLHIDSRFDNTQRYIWTADKSGASRAWVVNFSSGFCSSIDVDVSFVSHVRAVR